MLVLPICRGALLAFLVFLLLATPTCRGNNESVEVVGIVECADCTQKNIKTIQAFIGLRVNVDCKSADGKLRTRGATELDREGKFRASLPDEIVKDGELKEDCFAHLHSASGAPCAFHDDPEASKLMFKSKANGKQTFGLTGKLKFSLTTCTSAFLWPFFKYPPLPHWPTWPNQPPLPGSPTGYPPPQPKASPPAPVYNDPLPPPPTLSPPVPIYRQPPPPPTPVPIYNKPPQPPTLPPPVPIYKLPPPPLPPPRLPPPVPIYRQPPLPPTPVPIYKKPPQPPTLPAPVPIYMPPPVPVYNKPPQQIPKAPQIPTLPATPKIPRRYFNQPPLPRPSHP